MIKLSSVKVGTKFIGNGSEAEFEVVDIKRNMLRAFSPRVIIKDLRTGIVVPCSLRSFSMCGVSMVNNQ